MAVTGVSDKLTGLIAPRHVLSRGASSQEPMTSTLFDAMRKSATPLPLSDSMRDRALEDLAARCARDLGFELFIGGFGLNTSLRHLFQLAGCFKCLRQTFALGLFLQPARELSEFLRQRSRRSAWYRISLRSAVKP